MKRMKKFKRKNRRIKYNEENYINKNYMRYGRAIIPVQLNSIDELFMKHDYKQFELSDDVCKYIEEIAYMIPMSTDITIEIHCPEVNDIQKEKMIKAIKNNYGMEIDDMDYEINKVNSKSFIYGNVGLIILIINLLTEKYIGPVLSNFICVIWWVAIWEMAELQTMDKQDLKWKRLNYQQLYDANITFVFENIEQNDTKI
ncbi:MAG: hypothetical protein IJO57_00415 [Bacilli bacterium]|nr:hypothetical protein [Bacilli bacterium]